MFSVTTHIHLHYLVSGYAILDTDFEVIAEQRNCEILKSDFKFVTNLELCNKDSNCHELGDVLWIEYVDVYINCKTEKIPLPIIQQISRYFTNQRVQCKHLESNKMRTNTILCSKLH